MVGKGKISLQRYFPRNITALFTWDPAIPSMLSSRPSLLTWMLFGSLKFHKRSPILLGWSWKIRLFLQVFPPGTPPRAFRGDQEECFPQGAGQGRTTATAEIPPLFSSPRKGNKTLVWWKFTEAEVKRNKTLLPLEGQECMLVTALHLEEGKSTWGTTESQIDSACLRLRRD